MNGVIFPEHIRRHPQLTTSDKMVWMAIRNICKNGNATATLQEIGHYIDLTKSLVSKKTIKLEELGLIKIHRNYDQGHQPNTYEMASE